MEQKHDIIFNKTGEHAGYWVCKCGKGGRLPSEMRIHEQEIEAECIHDQQVEHLLNGVENVEC